MLHPFQLLRETVTTPVKSPPLELADSCCASPKVWEALLRERREPSAKPAPTAESKRDELRRKCMPVVKLDRCWIHPHRVRKPGRARSMDRGLQSKRDILGDRTELQVAIAAPRSPRSAPCPRRTAAALCVNHTSIIFHRAPRMHVCAQVQPGWVASTVIRRPSGYMHVHARQEICGRRRRKSFAASANRFRYRRTSESLCVGELQSDPPSSEGSEQCNGQSSGLEAVYGWKRNGKRGEEGQRDRLLEAVLLVRNHDKSKTQAPVHFRLFRRSAVSSSCRALIVAAG